MKILYLHQYFITRGSQGGTRSYEAAKYLVRQGHEVTMVTSGLLNPEFELSGDAATGEREIDGIRVVYVAAGYNDARMGTSLSGWRRMLKFLQFAKAAGRVGAGLEKPDVVFATHTPLPIGLAGIRLGEHFDVPFVFEVRDLWPEAMVNIGALTNPLAIWWLRRMAKKIYAAADHVVALSPGMKDGIVRAGTKADRVTVIPNASDLDLFNPAVDGAAARRRLGLGERFAAVYFGAMGLANGLDYALKAARILQQRGNDRIVIVLHGAGGKKAELEQTAREWQLDNVVFSPPVPDKADVAKIVAACDVCMTIYRAAKEQTWSPNKMFDALAAGKPVLINVKGWLGQTIDDNRCGRSLDPTGPEELADALAEFAAAPDLCREMGERARALAEREFAREKLAAKLERVLSDAVTAYR